MTEVTTPLMDLHFPEGKPPCNLLVEKLEHYAGPENFEPAHVGDAGIDLYAAETVGITPGAWCIVKCGIKLAIPTGMEGQIRPKSGRALNDGMVVLNSPGTIDEGYRGEIKVIIHNVNGMDKNDWYNVRLGVVSSTLEAQGPHSEFQEMMDQIFYHLLRKTLHISTGDKIAQIVFSKYERPPVRYVQRVDDTERGEDGFGSTGVNFSTSGAFPKEARFRPESLVDEFSLP